MSLFVNYIPDSRNNNSQINKIIKIKNIETYEF